MHEKTNNMGFQPGLTQTDLYSHRRRLETRNFRFKKKDRIILVAETKTLISCALTACYLFSYSVAHLLSTRQHVDYSKV